MAELGDLAAALGVDEKDKKIEIATEMLDYKYVEDCDDTRKLKGILETLRSGRDGFYPDVRALSLSLYLYSFFFLLSIYCVIIVLTFSILYLSLCISLSVSSWNVSLKRNYSPFSPKRSV